jgi:hypothetical protein
MRKSSITVTFDYFFAWTIWYAELLNKIFRARSIVKSKWEKTELFEALVFKFIATWEILVDELLVDCLNYDSTQYARHMHLSLPRNIPRDQCRAMICGLTYVDFKSISDIKKIAKNILVPKHNPLTSIPKSYSDKIDEFYKIRNYLAHYSRAAERSLNNMYKQAYGLRTFRRPGDFLIAWDNNNQQTRFGNYIDAFLGAAASMAEFCHIQY